MVPVIVAQNLSLHSRNIDKIEGNDNTEVETINQRSALPRKLNVKQCLN